MKNGLRLQRQLLHMYTTYDELSDLNLVLSPTPDFPPFFTRYRCWRKIEGSLYLAIVNCIFCKTVYIYIYIYTYYFSMEDIHV